MIQNNIFHLLIFIIFIFSFSFQIINIPSRDSFIPINPNNFTLFELKEGQRELYYTFFNNFSESDIVINLKKAKQYTTRLYFYDSYEDIKINSDGEFIDFLEELDLSDKFLYIKGCQNKTYYIVIKDLGDYSTKDYFSIYNEQEILELKQNEPFTINLFLSQNLYKFSFKGEKDDLISIDMNINNKDFSETIVIYLDNDKIYREEINKGLIKLNENKTLEGVYTIYLSSTNDEVYTYIKSSIILYKEKYETIHLEPEKEINLFYINSKSFSFYVDINDYELNEENIITFKFSHSAVKNKSIEYCYAKNMNFKEFDDNTFINNMPTHEEESEADFSKLNTLVHVYHLYYSRTQKKEEDKKSYLLIHCSIKIDDEFFYEPEIIKVYLSSRAINLDFSDKSYLDNNNIKINYKININDFIPKIFKINIPIYENPEDNKYSFVFYTYNQIQTIFKNTMINVDHQNEELIQIFAISQKNIQISEKNKILYIKLFGAKQEINFKIESAYADIYYLHGISRPIKVLSQQHLNCGNSFYYIGSYTVLAEDTYFYLEEIYGKYNIYYKNTITDDEDDTILTNGNSKYLLNEKTGTLNKTFDIIEIKCQYPGYFNFHLLKNYFTRTLTMYQRQVAFAPQGQLYIYPKTIENQTNINLELTTLLGKEVEIYVYNNSNTQYIINSNNKYFQIKYKNAETVPSYIRLYVKENNTLLSIRLTDENLYEIVDNNRSRINKERILFKLANNQDYKQVNVTLTNISHDYAYTIFRGDISYAIDLLLSEYDTISLKNNSYLNLILSNPYIKSYSMIADKEDSPFYIMLYIYDPEGIQKDVYMEYTPIDKYEDIPNSISRIYNVKDDKYSLNIDKNISKVSIVYQSCENSLKGINIYSYDDLFNSFEVSNKLNLAVFNNYLTPSQIQPKFTKNETSQYCGAVIGISLNELTQNDISKYINLDYKVTQNGKKVNWPKIELSKEYIVYVINTKNKDLKYIHNPCYLDFIEKNSSIDKNESDPEYIAYYSTINNYYEIKENGLFIVTVLANMEGKIPMKYIYKELSYNSSSEPYDENEGHYVLLIILTVLIPIIILIIIVLIILLMRKNKQKEFNEPEERIKLLRDTTNSNISNSNQE